MPRGASVTPMPSGLLVPGKGPDVFGKNIRRLQQLLHALDAVNDFDQPGVMVVERTQHRASVKFAKFRPLLVGARGSAAVGDVQAGQRPDAVDALGIAARVCSRETSDSYPVRKLRR